MRGHLAERVQRQIKRATWILLCVVSPWVGGCAAPGEPIERRPPVPAAVTDLAAEQLGNTVILTFTMPKATEQRRPLKETPGIEIYRSVSPEAAGGHANEKPTLVATIPAGMVDTYVGAKGQARWVDMLAAADFSAPAVEAVYFVKTRASEKRASEDSNRVELRVYAAPGAIADLGAKFSREGVALKWTAPEKTVGGAAAGIVEYHIYRAEMPPAGTSAESAPSAPAPAPLPPGLAGVGTPKPRTTPIEIGTATTTEYEDRNFEFGRTYAYTVRSVTKHPEGLLESSDSNRVNVVTTDVFPPATPQGLVIVLVAAQGDVPAHLELSWAINSETDLAGYNVYRSEQVNERGTRQNGELLRTPAFRDMNAVTGRRYFYSVTAVDRTGNESAASAAVPGGVPADAP